MTSNVCLVRAKYLRTGRKRGQGVTDFGYYSSDDDLEMLLKEIDGLEDGDAVRNALERLVADDEAYFIEVFPTYEGVHVSMQSGSERVAAESSGGIGRANHGMRSSIYVDTGEALLPRDCKNDSVEINPDEMLEIYGDWALEHGGIRGLEIEDFDWDNLMDEEHIARR